MFKSNLVKYFLIFNGVILSTANLSASDHDIAKCEAGAVSHGSLQAIPGGGVHYRIVPDNAARQAEKEFNESLLGRRLAVITAKFDSLERDVSGIDGKITAIDNKLGNKLDILIAIGLTSLDNEVVSMRNMQDLLLRCGSTRPELQANLRARIEATNREIDRTRARIARASYSAVEAEGTARISDDCVKK